MTVDFGDFEMPDDPRLTEAFNLIRAVVVDADERAKGKLIEQISGNKATLTGSTKQSGADTRAPRGSAERLIDRALEEAAANGLTVLGIEACARTSFEKMVSTSAIRNWLKDNERKGKYKNAGGVWYLTKYAP